MIFSAVIVAFPSNPILEIGPSGNLSPCARTGTGSTTKAKIAVAHARPIALSAEPSPRRAGSAGGRAAYGTPAATRASAHRRPPPSILPAHLDPARRSHPWRRWGRAFVRSHERSFLNRTDGGRPDDM